MLDMLVTDLNKLCDELPFHTGWYLKDLRTGYTAHRNGHVVVPSASTRKIAIMMTALKAVHEGKLALDQPVTIQAKYQNNDSGCFQHLQPGFIIQLRDVLVMMIIVSDNTCTGTVVDMVGLDAINALSQAVGMRGTTHRYGIPPAGMAGYRPAPETNATTPADVGILLERILQGSQDPAVRSAARQHASAVPVGPGYLELAAPAESLAGAVASRHQSGAQDRDHRTQLQRCRDYLPGESAALHPERLY